IVVNAAAAAAGALERVADVPINFADPLVRRAPSLQKAKDSSMPTARMSPATLAGTGIAAGDRVRISQGSAHAELIAQADRGLADGCVRVAAAHPTTAALGAMSGDLNVERV